MIASSIAFALRPKEDGNTEAPEAQVIVDVNSPVPSFSMAPSSIDLSPGATCQMDPDCGATLETWTGIGGLTVLDLMSGTNNFMNTPNRTARLGSLLEAPPSTDDNYGIRMKGWLMPPVSGVYAFWIASDDGGELLLSSDENPENMVRECFVPWFTGVREWYKFPYQKSPSIRLEARKAYYFEVSPAIIFAAFHFAYSKPLHKLSFVVCTLQHPLNSLYLIFFNFTEGSNERWRWQ